MRSARTQAKAAQIGLQKTRFFHAGFRLLSFVKTRPPSTHTHVERPVAWVAFSRIFSLQQIGIAAQRSLPITIGRQRKPPGLHRSLLSLQRFAAAREDLCDTK
jgi:hypothetical protein